MVYTNNFTESFNQYRNRQRYFRFIISNPDQGLELKDDKSGFIDPLKPQEYVDFDPESGTFEKYKSKARGNLRWINLCMYLSRYGVNYMQVNKITSDGDAYDTEEGEGGATSTPTEITFTMGFDNANYMYYKNSEGEEFTSEDVIIVNPGDDTPPTDSQPATRLLKAIVADCLINDYRGIMDVWDPTKDTYGKNPSDTPLGLKTPELVAEKIISTLPEADIVTIYELPNTPEYPQDIDS